MNCLILGLSFVLVAGLLSSVSAQTDDSQQEKVIAYLNLSNHKIVGSGTDDSVTKLVLVVQNNLSDTIVLNTDAFKGVPFPVKFDGSDVDFSIDPTESKMFSLVTTIPPSSMGNFTETVMLSYSMKGSDSVLSKSLHADIAVYLPPAKISSVSYESIIVILAGFLIPAQIVERIVELLRPIIDRIIDYGMIDRDNETRTQILDRLMKISNSPSGKKEAFDAEINEVIKYHLGTSKGPHYQEEAIQRLTELRKAFVEKHKQADLDGYAKTGIPEYLGKKLFEMIDAEITLAKKIISVHNHQVILATWITAMLLSILPSLVLTWNDFGLVHLLDPLSPSADFYDFGLNVFFIASGTNILHGLIKQIKEFRK